MIQQEIIRPTYEVFNKYVDAFTAYFIEDTGKLPSTTTLFEFLTWIHQKSIDTSRQKVSDKHVHP